MLWCALLFCPGGTIVFFKSGPMAWNGVIAWWVVIVAFATWMSALVYGLLKYAIPHQERKSDAQLTAG
jgi:hypothetical protein